MLTPIKQNFKPLKKDKICKYLYLELLLNSQEKDMVKFGWFNNSKFKLNRGQVLFSQSMYCKKLGATRQKLRLAISKLQHKYKLIKVDSNYKYSVVTIKNYSSLQKQPTQNRQETRPKSSKSQTKKPKLSTKTTNSYNNSDIKYKDKKEKNKQAIKKEKNLLFPQELEKEDDELIEMYVDLRRRKTKILNLGGYRNKIKMVFMENKELKRKEFKELIQNDLEKEKLEKQEAEKIKIQKELNQSPGYFEFQDFCKSYEPEKVEDRVRYEKKAMDEIGTSDTIDELKELKISRFMFKLWKPKYYEKSKLDSEKERQKFDIWLKKRKI